MSHTSLSPYLDKLLPIRPLALSRALSTRASQVVAGLERDHGLRTFVSDDPYHLLHVQQMEEKKGFLPLFPTLNVNIGPEAERLWIALCSGDQIVATGCAVNFYIPFPQALSQHFESLSLLYRNPERARQEGAQVHCSAAIAHVIRGHITFILGMWTHPDWGRRGLARKACNLVMIMAYSHFLSDWFLGLVDEKSSTTLSWRNPKYPDAGGYLFRHREPEIIIRVPGWEPMVEDLLATTRSQFEADLLGYNQPMSSIETKVQQPDIIDRFPQMA